MSTGTYDFIDSVEPLMLKGRHSFVLLALDSIDNANTPRYSIRSGVIRVGDVDKLLALVDGPVHEHLEKLKG